MKKTAVSLGRILFILLLLAGLSVCTMSDQSESPPPEDAISFDQLLENLDELQGPAMQSPSAPGRSVFSLPDGSLLSSADLSAYINAIKKDLAAYIYSCTGGKPYLVVAKRVKWGAGADTESGLIWVPFTWWQPKSFPIISYQHGTQVYRLCAPSQYNANPLAILASSDLTGALQNYVECVVGALMATAGYIVAMPDYAGFGVNGETHPYVHLSLGESVSAIVQLALAAFKSGTVTTNRDVYLTGYSEGGYATMAGARSLQPLQTTYQFRLATTVPCDGPYSLAQTEETYSPGVMLGQMLSGDTVEVPSYLLYTASGYDAAYPDPDGIGGSPDPIDLYALLTNEWADKIVVEKLYDGWHTNADVGREVPSTTIPRNMINDPDGFVLLNPGTGSVFNLLEANNAWQGWTPANTYPPSIVFVHCPDDDVVPYENAEAAADHYGIPRGLICKVDPVPFIETVMGTRHVAAYPTAMLAAFKIIRAY